jgi:hypothetical protein
MSRHMLRERYVNRELYVPLSSRVNRSRGWPGWHCWVLSPHATLFASLAHFLVPGFLFSLSVSLRSLSRLSLSSHCWRSAVWPSISHPNPPVACLASLMQVLNTFERPHRSDLTRSCGWVSRQCGRLRGSGSPRLQQEAARHSIHQL